MRTAADEQMLGFPFAVSIFSPSSSKSPLRYLRSSSVNLLRGSNSIEIRTALPCTLYSTPESCQTRMHRKLWHQDPDWWPLHPPAAYTYLEHKPFKLKYSLCIGSSKDFCYSNRVLTHFKWVVKGTHKWTGTIEDSFWLWTSLKTFTNRKKIKDTPISPGCSQ